MIAIKAHFDGKYLVPDEPVEIPRDKPLIVQVEIAAPADRIQKRRAGLSRDTAWTSADFDTPLADEFWLGRDA